MLNVRLPKVKGTKKSVPNNQLLVSLGLPSLDTVVGGGIPVGSLFLVEEDEFGAFSNIVMRHYLAEGVVSEHDILFISQEVNTRTFINELPAPTNADQHEEKSSADKLPAAMEELKIAWRYQDLSPASPAEPAKSDNLFGHTYDLSKRLDKNVIEKATVSHWKEELGDFTYDNLLAYVRQLAQTPKYSLDAPVENRTVLRVALHLLGTMLWEGDLIWFLVNLRNVLRNTCSTCFITVSPSLFDVSIVDNSAWFNYMLHRCEHVCDTVIRLQSLVNEGNPAYSDYSGLLILEKLPIINSWNSYIPETNDWAFTLKKRKHFLIEKLHISPDIGENVHRETEDVSAEYQTQKILKNVSEQF